MSNSTDLSGDISLDIHTFMLQKNHKQQMTQLKIILISTIRIRGNYGNNVILVEGKRSPKLLNFSEIFNKPLPFHDKATVIFFAL